jgi:hypothetical protein
VGVPRTIIDALGQARIDICPLGDSVLASGGRYRDLTVGKSSYSDPV